MSAHKKFLVLFCSLILGFLVTPSFADEGEAQRIIVKYKKAPSASKRSMGFRSQVAGVKVTQAKPLFGNTYVLTLDKQGLKALGSQSKRNASEVSQTILQQLNADPNIEYAVIDRKMRIALARSQDEDDFYIPEVTDVSHADQWDLALPPAGVDADGAWAMSQGSPDVVVAVVDSGILPHDDLDANVLPGYNLIDNNSDALDLGTVPHGTHVAGTIAANGKILGVAPQVKILPIKVLDEKGMGYSSDIVKGIYWALGDLVEGVETVNPYPAKVINLSLGGFGYCDRLWYDVVQRARAKGVTVVVAAGNESFDVFISVPANCPGVVSVAATNREGQRSFYSNYGGFTIIAAPGGEQHEFGSANGILSTVGNNAYAYFQGTSMAAPHVAGVVALIYSVAPDFSVEQVTRILKESAQAFPKQEQEDEYSCTGRVYACGAGIANASAAVAAALQQAA